MALLSEEGVSGAETGQKLGLALQLSCVCRGKALGEKSTDETPCFNMEKAPYWKFWWEDHDNHSIHLTKPLTLRSSVKDEGGEKATGKNKKQWQCRQGAHRLWGKKPAPWHHSGRWSRGCWCKGRSQSPWLWMKEAVWYLLGVGEIISWKRWRIL